MGGRPQVCGGHPQTSFFSHYPFWFSVFVLETGPHCEAQAGLKLRALPACGVLGGLPICFPGPGIQAHATSLAFYVHPAHRAQVFLLVWQAGTLLT